MIYTWIFNSTRGSLLLPLLFHAAGNITANLLPFLPPAVDDLRMCFFNVAINWLIALTIVLATKGSLQSEKELPEKAISNIAA